MIIYLTYRYIVIHSKYATFTYSLDTFVMEKDKEKVWECQHYNSMKETETYTYLFRLKKSSQSILKQSVT
jgi:hypothetical protein